MSAEASHESQSPTQWLRQEAEGRWSAPAFFDRHCHPLFATRELETINISQCHSLEEIVSTLCDYLQQNPETTWLDAAPFDRNIDCDFVASELDVVSTRVPITLHSSDHHALWVNSAALEVAGLHQSVPKLRDAEVVCNPEGLATGMLLEWSAMKIMLDHMPMPTLEHDLEFLARAQDHLFAAGIVGVTDAWIDPGMGEVYVEADKRGLLRMPVELWVRISPDDSVQQLVYLEQLRAMASNCPNVIVRGIKVFIDGVITSGTAALREGYLTIEAPASTIWSGKELEELLVKLSGISTTLRPHFHAIGDLAISAALESISFARSALLWRGPQRPVLAHAEVVRASDCDLMAQLDVEAAISPQWLANRADYTRVLKRDACLKVGDFSGMLEAGVCLTYGSDWPVTPPNALSAIAEATKWLVGQQKPLDEALEAAWRIASGPTWASGASAINQPRVYFEENPLQAAINDINALADLNISLH